MAAHKNGNGKEKEVLEKWERDSVPSSVADAGESFAAEGGYGPGPTGRGPYSQPNTYSERPKDRTGGVIHYTQEETEAAEESAREGNVERGRMNEKLEGHESETGST